jgi:iron-sulfur cluster repair protein YtfE (RIC family)
MNIEAVRAKLVEQHDRLRARLDTCSRLARLLRDGVPVHAELDLELAELRAEFAEHNETETAVVRPLLHDSPDWGVLLIDRMLEEHVGEHAAFWEALAGSPEDVAVRMDDLVDELDAHMAAEERTFLNPTVLRHDVITRHRL